jgi:mono/diheme cytochrome c family protein
MKSLYTYGCVLFSALALTLVVSVAIGFTGRPRAAFADEKKSNNPLSGDPKAIEAGQTAFRGGFCANCHGMNGNGAGRGAPNAANLQKFKRGYSAFVKTVKEGYKTMPPWGGGPILDEETINKIGAWLETKAQADANWADGQ